MEQPKNYETREEGAARVRRDRPSVGPTRYVVAPGRTVLHEGRTWASGEEVPPELALRPPFLGRAIVSTEAAPAVKPEAKPKE